MQRRTIIVLTATGWIMLIMLLAGTPPQWSNVVEFFAGWLFAATISAAALYWYELR